MMADDSTLIEYALGSLDPAMVADVERQLARSPELQAQLKQIEADLSWFALTSEPVSPNPQLREQILKASAPQPDYEAFADRLSVFFDLSVERVRELLSQIKKIPHAPWNELFPGAQVLSFRGGPERSSANCSLLYMKPETKFPMHQHIGDEWAILLDGRAQEPDGSEYNVGDILHKPAGSTHSFRALDKPCVFAVVLYAGIEWRQD